MTCIYPSIREGSTREEKRREEKRSEGGDGHVPQGDAMALIDTVLRLIDERAISGSMKSVI